MTRHLTDRPQTKRRLAFLEYGCTCPSATCSHQRDIEEGIRRLILAGEWIVSNGAGYRLTESAEDVERYIVSLEGRRDSLNKRIGALRRSLEARRAAEYTQEGLPWAA